MENAPPMNDGAQAAEVDLPSPAAPLATDALDADAEADAGVMVVKRGDAEFMEGIYQAVSTACEVAGRSSAQLPGRDKILQVMRSNFHSIGKKVSGFTVWRNTLEFLKMANLVYTVPNSGTFVKIDGKHGSIGQVLDLIETGVRIEDLGYQADLRRHLKGLKVTRSNSGNSGGVTYSSESTVVAEAGDEEDASEGGQGSSEEEIAAVILQDLKFTKEEEELKTKASSQAAPALVATRKPQPAKKRGGYQPSTFDPSTVGFPLKGPWVPATDEEETEYYDFLNVLVRGNRNVTSWTHARLKKSVAAIFGVLHAAPRGLTRIELRNAARAYVGDTGLLDYTIKVLVNMTLCGFYMRRETDPQTGKLLYSVGFVEGGQKEPYPHFQPCAAYREGMAAAGITNDENIPPAPGRKRRERGKRQVHSPKRFEDYNQAYGTNVQKAPPVKRSRYSQGAVPRSVSNPLPPKLDDSFACRQQRVSIEQGEVVAGRTHDHTAAAEVNSIIFNAVSHSGVGLNNANNWVKVVLHNEIMKEMALAVKDSNDLGEQTKQAVTTLG